MICLCISRSASVFSFAKYLPSPCRLWEASIEQASQLGKRVVKLRTGIVLSNEGGAFVEFKKPLRFRIAAILGSGKQIVSWLHIDDLCSMWATIPVSNDWIFFCAIEIHREEHPAIEFIAVVILDLENTQLAHRIFTDGICSLQ